MDCGNGCATMLPRDAPFSIFFYFFFFFFFFFTGPPFPILVQGKKIPQYTSSLPFLFRLLSFSFTVTVIIPRLWVPLDCRSGPFSVFLRHSCVQLSYTL